MTGNPAYASGPVGAISSAAWPSAARCSRTRRTELVTPLTWGRNDSVTTRTRSFEVVGRGRVTRFAGTVRLRRRLSSRSMARTLGRRPQRIVVSTRPTREQRASGFGRGQLAAGSVDLAAAGVADRRRDALGLETPDELALVLGVRGGPLGSRRRVERDQVDVHPAPVSVGVEHVSQQVGTRGLVVDAAHHGVLDRDAAL